MVRFLIRIGITLASAVVGLVLSALLLDDFHLQPSGFLTAAVVLTVAQSLLTPFVVKITRRHASALLGGVGIVSTLLALLLAGLVPGGITVSSATTWVVAALIVWLAVALGGWLLLGVVLKRYAAARSKRPAKS